MTMYYISEFCRICLQNDSNLIDIMKIENEPSETLLTKLKLCVSEVEWTTLKVLMCNSCIKRLNSSYDFKKQCIRSSIALKNYIELLNDSQNLTDSTDKQQLEISKLESFIPLVPNQKIVKLLVPPTATQNNTQNNSFQNVFLNVIPSAKPVQNGTTQNMFLNINNILQTIVPLEQNDTALQPDINVSKILTESTSEELSIEIDPTDYGCMSENSPGDLITQETEVKDWDEVISSTKITSQMPALVPLKSSDEESTCDEKTRSIINSYIPILPKPDFNHEISMEEKYEFFNSGHFMSSDNMSETNSAPNCEICDKTFESMSFLRSHMKQFHLGKFPYQCEYCHKEFGAHRAYDSHVRMHVRENEETNRTSLTLKDFTDNNIDAINVAASSLDVSTDNDATDGGEHKCDSCDRTFSSANGLLRHRVRKHKQKARRKYFIKGQKNAKCDICNREFSTQSYMQMHKKLHLRHGVDYKGKVFNRIKKKVEIICKKNIIENGMEITDNTIIKEDDDDTPNEIVSDKSCNENEIIINEESKNEIDIKDNESKQHNDSNEKQENEIDDINVIQEVQLVNIINIAPFYDIDQGEIDSKNEFKNLDALKVDNSTQCIYCNKVFSRKHDLKRHLNNIHLKSIQFKCHLCNNTFYEAFHLTRHLRAHYSCASCTICQKMFSTENDMAQHNQMIHDGMAFWQCGVCYVMFNEPYMLKQHMLDHQGPIIYRCHLCDDEFAESRDLSRHIIEHSGMYSCRICQKSFANEHEKSVHDVNTHGPTKKYECDLCSKSYKKIHELTRHRNLHLLLLSQEKKESLKNDESHE